MAQLNFDASTVEPDTGFDTVPPGWYNVSIDESDLKPTKDGAGTYLQLRFNILDGQYHGRKLFARLNIRNANAQTVEIALRQLSAIGHAVGVLQIADSQQLHGKPLKVKVKIRPGDDQYEAQNDIISYKNINEPVETVGGAPMQAQAPLNQQGFGQPQAPQGFGQPQQFQAPQQPQFAPQQQPQQPQQQFQQPQQPQQQFQPPAQEQAQQPWQQPPLQNAPPPQQDPNNPFQAQPQPNQQQPWQQAPQPQQVQQQPQQQPDPHAGAAAAAQQAAPPWAPQQ